MICWRRLAGAALVLGAVGGVLALWVPLASANVTGISVSVSSGGSCTDASTPLGFDDAFVCSLVEGDSLVVVGSANSNQNTLRLWWSSTGGVTDQESQGALQVDVLPDFSTRYWRENTATLTCTSDGTATLTARDSSDTDKIKLTIDCEPPPEVEITGFVDGSVTRSDADPVVFARSIVVSPFNATCEHSYVSGVGATRRWSDNHGSDRRLTVSVSSWSGTAVVEVECSLSGYTATAVEASFEVEQDDVSISGWGGERRQLSRPGTVTLSDSFDVSPSDATCTSDQVGSGTSASVGSPSGSGTRRTVSVTVTNSDPAVVEVECERAGYITASAQATFVALAPAVSITAVAGGTRDGPGVMTGSFTVSPSWADCAAEQSSGISAWVDAYTGTGASRSVSVDTVSGGVPRTGAVSVRVSCEATGYVTSSATVAFTARRVAVSIIGFVDASGDAAIDASESFLVWPDTAECTAAGVSGDADADVGIAADATLLGRYTVTVGSDVVGTVGVRVRCTATAYNVGTDTQNFVFAALPSVSISDAAGGSRDGPGVMTGTFTVTPASADCTAEWVSGISATVGAPTGAGSASRSVSVDTVVGGVARTGDVAVTVTCSLADDATITVAETMSFEARRIAVSIIGLADASGDVTFAETEGFLVRPVTAECAPLVVSGDEDAAVSVADGLDTVGRQLLSVSSVVVGTVQIQVTCTAAGYDDGADTVDFDFAALAEVVISDFEGAVESVAVLSGGFGVSPAVAMCRTAHWGVPASVSFTDNDGAERAVRVAVTGSATGKVTVTVTCDAPRHVTASATAEFVRTGDCSTDLGLLDAGTQTRTGTISSTGGCLSWKRGTEASPNYARRYTLRVPAASKITVDASSSAVDVYLYALRGSGAASQVLGSDDNSGSANAGDARIADVPVVFGLVYVIEVTTSTARDTGAFTLTVLTALDLPLVQIIDLDNRIESGFGTVSVDEDFTVDPPTAVCTSAPLGTVTAGTEAADRTLSADLAIGATSAVTVTCSVEGYADGIRDVQLTARSAAAVSDVSVTATARGTCAATTAAGFDKAYVCTMTRGDSLEVSATADANTDGAAIGWASGSGISVSAGASRPAAQINSPDGASSYWQAVRAAAIGCTATGSATLTVTLPDAANYTVKVGVTCEAPAAVLISGFDAAEARGDGTVSVPGGFEVSPGTAECSATASSGTASVSGEGNRRTVTAAVASGTTVTVTVTCSQAPLAGDSATALFSAGPADGCNDPLGSLPQGVTTVSGMITADAQCTSLQRHGIVFPIATQYARRHTFSLAGPATVTIDLAAAGASVHRLDLFLMLLGEHNAGTGAILHADDDSGEFGNDSRLADLDLAGGDYTVEATTYSAGATGSYSLSVDVDYDAAVQVSGLDSTARVGDVDVTDQITVTPAAATCTAASTVGTATVAPTTGATRTVILPMTAPASAVVTVTCVADGHAGGTATAVFSVSEPAEVSSVSVTSSGACTAAPGAAPEGVDAALVCTFVAGDPVTVTVTAVASHATIALGWATAGGVTAALASVPAATLQPDGRWQSTADSLLACSADGTATLTVTAGTAPDTGTRTTQLTVVCQTRVRIIGLEDTTQSGVGTVTVADTFTVDPATAVCTAAPVGTVTVDLDSAAGRVVSVELATGAAATVSVSCANVGNADGIEDVVLAARRAFGGVVVSAASGGSCAVGAAAGFHAAFGCVMVLGEPLLVSATVTSVDGGAVLSWAGSADVTVGSPSHGAAVLQQAPDGSATGYWTTTGTARLSCGADGAAVLTAVAGAVGGERSFVTRVGVDCQQRVAIVGLGDSTESGVGTVTVSGSFTVSPGTASCTGAATLGVAVVAVGPAVGERTVGVDLAAPGSAAVTVECVNEGNAPGLARALFAARFVDSCVDGVGVLGEGPVSVSGVIVVDSGCVSLQRWRDIGSLVYYARRHVFSLEVPARVTVGLGSADSNAYRLDTYVLLIEGRSSHGSGLVRGRNDDGGPGTDSLLSGVDLAPGDYTVEATTFGTREAGGYDVRVTAALAVAVDGLDDTIEEPDGSSSRTLSDDFAVTPATAVCTASAGTVSAGAGGARTLRVTLAAGQALRVAVACTGAGRPGGAAGAVFSVSGSCTAEPGSAARGGAGSAGFASAGAVCSGAEPDRCVVDLGALGLGRQFWPGTIRADSGCVSAQRDGPPGLSYYARRHHFALAEDAWVTVELDDDDADGRALNPYLLLIGGRSADGSGEVLGRHDDIGGTAGGYSTASRVGPVFLQAGDYTAEATASGAYIAGGYRLSVEVTATGLEQSYTAVVGAPRTITLDYWPPDAQIAVQAAAAPELQPVIATAVGAANGTATIALTPRFADTHQITVRVRSGTGTAARERNLSVGISAACPVDKQLSAYNGLLCVDRTGTDPVPEDEDGNVIDRYELTPGTLLGVLQSAQAAIDKRGADDTCGLTAVKLAAFMLSIGYREIPHRANGRIAVSPARSPMTLGRADSYTNMFLDSRSS